MEENKEFELDLSDETMKALEEYALEKGTTPEDVAEYIIYEFLRNQLHVIEKRAQETNTPLNDLINMQFVKILDFLKNQKN